MKMKPEEITAIIKKQIEDYNVEMNVDDVGTVLEVGDGIAHIYGLDKAMSGELLELPHGVYGMALNLEEDNVGAVLLGDDALIKEGDTVRRTGRVMRVPVGEAMIGRVVNPLGMPIDGKGEIKTKESRLIEVKAFGIADRQPVKVPLQTGLKAIDSMVPIGRGQRELIIGDRGTGKTAIAIDTILNQKDTGVICVYVAIGQKASTVARVVRTLEENGAMAYTIVVAATASDGAPLQYLAPYSGVSMAEYFMLQGKDCLCVYDDLSKHAQAYRAMSLLLRRPPGVKLIRATYSTYIPVSSNELLNCRMNSAAVRLRPCRSSKPWPVTCRLISRPTSFPSQTARSSWKQKPSTPESARLSTSASPYPVSAGLPRSRP